MSWLAFAEAGYKTVHISLPWLGSSEARTLPVATKVHKVKHAYSRVISIKRLPTLVEF